MKEGRIVAVTGAVAVLVVSIVASTWYRLPEDWHIYKLKHGTSEEQIKAAQVLGRMKSVKSVHVILEAMKRHATTGRQGAFLSVLSDIGEECMMELLRVIDEGPGYMVPYAVLALGRAYKMDPDGEGVVHIGVVLKRMRDDKLLGAAIRRMAERIIAKRSIAE